MRCITLLRSTSLTLRAHLSILFVEFMLEDHDA
jgi:hypothetical protein